MQMDIQGSKTMLILTRRVGETLMIGDDISVIVLGVQGNQIRLGTIAPKSVTVHREEIYDRIKASKKIEDPQQDPDSSE